MPGSQEEDAWLILPRETTAQKSWVSGDAVKIVTVFNAGKRVVMRELLVGGAENEAGPERRPLGPV